MASASASAASAASASAAATAAVRREGRRRREKIHQRVLNRSSITRRKSDINGTTKAQQKRFKKTPNLPPRFRS